MEAACCMCNGPLRKTFAENIVRNGNLYAVYVCERCNVGTTVLQPTAEELSRLYAFGRYRASSGKRFNCVVEAFIYLFRTGRRRRIEKYMKRGRILDIGCGRGLFLDIMKRAGWKVTGVEFDKETAAEVATRYDIPILAGDSDQWTHDDEAFDVITMNHVLEHIRTPVEMIGKCWRLLGKGGLLVVSIPNIESLQASVGKGVWFHLDIPYHLHHFSEEGLLDLLRKNSFAVASVGRFDLEFGPFGWLQTLLNLSGISENYFYNLLKRPDLRKRDLAHSSVMDFVLTVLLLPFYAPVSFLLSLVESLIMKKGGTIEVYAIKE